jgi:hypothetical protein
MNGMLKEGQDQARVLDVGSEGYVAKNLALRGNVFGM